MPISGFPGYYVSEAGHIFRDLPGRGLRPVSTRVDRHGYVRVWLFHPERPGVQVAKALARLVLEAFVGPPPTPEHQADHIDADPLNNVVTNLRWLTPAENVGASIARAGGRPHMRRGEPSSTAKLTPNEVVAIVREFLDGVPVRELARRYNVSGQTIRTLVRESTPRFQPRHEK